MKNISIKALSLSLCMVLIAHYVNAQMKIKYDNHISCSVFGKKGQKSDSLILQFSSLDITEILLNIVTEQGLEKDKFEIYKSYSIEYAYSSIKDKKPIVVYNPEYIQRLKLKYDSDWPVVFIIAHEMGHHLNADMIGETGSQPKLERAADFFAGNVLRKLGATLEEALLIQDEFEIEANQTHPSKSERLEEIKAGWKKTQCGGKGEVTFKNTTKRQITITYDAMEQQQGNNIIIPSGATQGLTLNEGTYYFNATTISERKHKVTLEREQISIIRCKEILRDIGDNCNGERTVAFKNNRSKKLGILIEDEKGQRVYDISIPPESEVHRVLEIGKQYSHRRKKTGRGRGSESIILNSCDDGKTIEYNPDNKTKSKSVAQRSPAAVYSEQTTGQIAVTNLYKENIKISVVPERICGFVLEDAKSQQEIDSKQSYVYKEMLPGKYCVHIFKYRSDPTNTSEERILKQGIKAFEAFYRNQGGSSSNNNTPNIITNNNSSVKSGYSTYRTKTVTVKSGKQRQLSVR